MATANFLIAPEDGWIAVTSAGVDYIRIRSNTTNQPFFITTDSTPPAASVQGYKVDCGEICIDSPVADNFYVRAGDTVAGKSRFDVFFVAT